MINYIIEFNFKGEEIKFESKVFREVYTNTIDFMYKNDYSFDENVKGRQDRQARDAKNKAAQERRLAAEKDGDLPVAHN
jgi:hypothetical protein